MSDSTPTRAVSTPTPTPTQPQPSHGLPARPIPTEPARHNQPHSDRSRDSYKQPSKPIPTQPAAAAHAASHSKLPKGPKQRGTSPDPVAIRKRWEQRDMSKEQRERADKAAENERREYASYHTAVRLHLSFSCIYCLLIGLRRTDVGVSPQEPVNCLFRVEKKAQTGNA